MYIYCSLLADHIRPFQCTLLCNAHLLGCSKKAYQGGIFTLLCKACTVLTMTCENPQARGACNCTKTDTKMGQFSLSRMMPCRR